MEKSSLFGLIRKNEVKKVIKLLESHLEQNKEMLEEKEEHGNTPLHVAAGKGLLDIVRALYHHGARLDVRNENGVTPLMAALHGKHVDVVKFLVCNGASPNPPLMTRKHSLPLYLALKFCGAEVGALLMAFGAEPNYECQQEFSANLGECEKMLKAGRWDRAVLEEELREEQGGLAFILEMGSLANDLKDIAPLPGREKEKEKERGKKNEKEKEKGTASKQRKKQQQKQQQKQKPSTKEEEKKAKKKNGEAAAAVLHVGNEYDDSDPLLPLRHFFKAQPEISLKDVDLVLGNFEREGMVSWELWSDLSEVDLVDMGVQSKEVRERFHTLIGEQGELRALLMRIDCLDAFPVLCFYKLHDRSLRARVNEDDSRSWPGVSVGKRKAIYKAFRGEVEAPPAAAAAAAAATPPALSRAACDASVASFGEPSMPYSSAVIGGLGTLGSGAPVDMASSTQTLRQIPWGELQLTKKLGAGAFGKVYHGTWKGADVAIKVLDNFIDDPEERVEFMREALMIQRLSSHPHVVSFVGAVATESRWAIVTDFAANGSLLVYLDKKRGDFAERRERARRKGGRERDLEKVDRAEERLLLHLALQVASALLFLHSEGVIHRDIAARNVLVNAAEQALLADFGLSRLLDLAETSGTTKSNIGPIKWSAPEAIRGTRRYSGKSDVFSFGVLIWEMFTGREPWAGVPAVDVIQVIVQGERLSLEKDVFPCGPLRPLIASMWIQDEEKRPTIKQVGLALAERLHKLDKHFVVGRIWKAGSEQEEEEDSESALSITEEVIETSVLSFAYDLDRSQAKEADYF